MAKTAKRHIGDTGEGVACKYLEGRGYRVVERNYLKPWGEIDIVATKANKLYFVEVKTVSRDTRVGEPAIEGREVTREPREGGALLRGEPAPYRPEENVHLGKIKRLHRAIQTYLLDHKVPEDMPWQLDVVCVYLDFATRKARVEILENVIL